MIYNLLQPINWRGFGFVMLILTVVALIFTVLILLISKYCSVEEDPRIEEVKDKLSGANCGGCGFAGCADFAKAVVEGHADLSRCASTSKENKEAIAKLLGVQASSSEPMMAVVKCTGDNEKAVKTFCYVGNQTCIQKSAYFGGDKQCKSGCLGDGYCLTKCAFGAISTENGVAKVDKNLCTGCGACANNCPKTAIELIPRSATVYVACSSKCKGKDVINACKAGCIACGLCAKACPNGAITLVDNLPVIDYSLCSGCKSCVVKCPKKVIKEI